MTSTTMLEMIRTAAPNRAVAATTGRSRWATAWRLHSPMPSMSKIFSVKIVPASRVPKSMPKIVMTGTSAERRACL